MKPAPPVMTTRTARHRIAGGVPSPTLRVCSDEGVGFVMLAAGFAAVAGLLWLAPDLLDRLPPEANWAIALVSAGALAGAEGAPTGWTPLDVLLRAALGAAVPLVAARLGAWAAAWVAGVAALVLAVADAPFEALAYIAAGAVLASIASAIDSDVLRAAAAAAALQPLVRTDWPLVSSASSVAVAVAVVPVLVAGIGTLGDRERRITRWVTVAALGICVVGGALGGLAALAARSAVDRGVDAALAGLDSFGSDERDQAQQQLQSSAAEFSDAHGILDAWWAKPAYLVPGVAQQARAVTAMAESGRELSVVAADAVERADPDSVRPRDGVVDLDALARLEDPLDDALRSLDAADRRLRGAETSVLLPPVADRMDTLRGKVSDALVQARTAASAVAVAPELLGRDGPKRFLLALQTPSEARGVGGFMGSWGELETDGGRIDLVRTGRLKELTEGGDPTGRRIEGHPEFVARYGPGAARYWGTIGFSPDFPTVASIMAQLYPESGGREVDGVIGVDPFGYAAFLELTGPISVPGFAEQLTKDNAARILLHEQYLQTTGDDAARVEFLEQATRALFDRITSGALPGPGLIARALGPAVDGKHLQLYSVDDAAQGFFAQIGATSAVPPLRGDSVGVVGQNYSGNKIDWFLRRSVAYDASWDPDTGEVRGELEITVRNEAPPSGLPHAIIGWGGDLILNQLEVEDGENLMLLSVYTAFPATGLTVDGEALSANHQQEFGRHVYSFLLRVPPQGTRTVTVSVQGALPADVPYRFDPIWQVLPTPDQLAVTVSLAPDWDVERASGARRLSPGVAGGAWALDQGVPIEVHAEKRDPSWLERLRGD